MQKCKIEKAKPNIGLVDVSIPGRSGRLPRSKTAYRLAVQLENRCASLSRVQFDVTLPIGRNQKHIAGFV